MTSEEQIKLLNAKLEVATDTLTLMSIRMTHSLSGSLSSDVELEFEQLIEVADKALAAIEREGDICGLCGKPGADKIAHPVHWPGELIPDGSIVHAECEAEECKRAHAELSDEERETFLRSL